MGSGSGFLFLDPQDVRNCKLLLPVTQLFQPSGLTRHNRLHPPKARTKLTLPTFVLSGILSQNQVIMSGGCTASRSGLLKSLCFYVRGAGPSQEQSRLTEVFSWGRFSFFSPFGVQSPALVRQSTVDTLNRSQCHSVQATCSLGAA